MDLERVAGVVSPVDEAAVQAELERYLRGEVVEKEWVPENVGQADWAMRFVAEARRKAGEYADEILLWTEAKQRMMRVAEWFEDRLAVWAIANRTERIKSQHLAHGTVRTSKHRPKVVVVDEAAVIEWADRMAPAAVRRDPRFLISEVGDAWKVSEVAVGFRAIHNTTGEVEEVPTRATADYGRDLERVRNKLGPEWSVSAITEPAVVESDTGELVPGVTVQPESVTASVTPLGV